MHKKPALWRRVLSEITSSLPYKNIRYIPGDEILAATGRPYDQIRSSVCIPRLNVKICGSSAGLSDFGDGASRLVTMTDVTSLTEQHRCLEEEIRHRDAAVHELEDKQRNIDAYLEALYQIPDLKEKQALFDGTKNEVLPQILSASACSVLTKHKEVK